MRGSTLLFNSLEALDPVSFDRVEDIIEEALEPELTYRIRDVNNPDRSYTHGQRNRLIGNSHITPKNKSDRDSTPDKSATRRSDNSSLIQEPSTEEQLLDLFQSDLSSFGSPLTKSNYFTRQTPHSQFKDNQLYDYSCENRRGSSSSISSASSSHSHSSTGSVESTNTAASTSSSSIASSVIGRKNIMSFHNHHNDGRKTFTSFGGSSSGMPLSKLRSERSCGGNHSFSQGNDQSRSSSNSSSSDHSNESGFSKFFSGLKSSSNKSDKNRFDVNNLPPQLKNELKRIYVY